MLPKACQNNYFHSVITLHNLTMPPWSTPYNLIQVRYSWSCHSPCFPGFTQSHLEGFSEWFCVSFSWLQSRPMCRGCHGTESSRSNCEWKQNLYLEHSKYSGCEEINGRAGADLSAVQVQWARQSRVYSPGREYSPDPSGNLPKRDQARTASGPGRLTQRINETPARQRSDNASQKRQPDIGSADELHL